MWCMMWSVMYYSPGWGELVSQSESTFKWCQLSLISRDRRFHGSSGQACRRSQHHSERFHLLARLQQAPFSASCHHVILCCHGNPLARLVIIAQNINLKNQNLQFWREKWSVSAAQKEISVASDSSAAPGWNLLPLLCMRFRFCMPLMFHQWFRTTSFTCSAPLSWMRHGAQRGAAQTVREWIMYNKWNGVNYLRWRFRKQPSVEYVHFTVN